jgi:cation diffusion facilitator family transporter
LFGAVFSGSAGLLADGLQSISCVIASGLIYYSVIISGKKQNKRFPYGYGKAEFLTALVVFSVLFALGLSICVSSMVIIFKRDLPAPQIIGLPIAVISIFLNFMMYKYSICAGAKLESTGMTANAYQNKADMWSSVGVGAGIILSQFGTGFTIFDPIAALIVGVIIIKDSYGHWISNIKAILDKVPDPHYKEQIDSIISEVIPGKSSSYIKIKGMGKTFWTGIGLTFHTDKDIHQWEMTTKRIKEKVMNKINWVSEVDFFIDQGE